jgi:hypothetical protein
MLSLPIDKRGYPVPWFVAWVNGEPEFRLLDPDKWLRATRNKLCWVCGERLGQYMAFVIGPMCGITRTTSEPPCHLECATWSAINCPFLARPNMVRRENDLPESTIAPPGVHLDRNPGVMLVWISKRPYQIFKDHQGRPLIQVGDPDSMKWYTEGREATTPEVLNAIYAGLPFVYSELPRGEQRDMFKEHAQDFLAQLPEAVPGTPNLLPNLDLPTGTNQVQSTNNDFPNDRK